MRHALGRWAGGVAVSLALSGGVSAQSAPAAYVNGEVITVDDWTARMRALQAHDFVTSTSPLRVKSASGAQVALEALVNGRLLLQYAAKTSLLPADAEVEGDLAVARRKPTVKEMLKRGILSESRLLEEIRIQRALFRVATINFSVTADDARSYYERHPEAFGRSETLRLALIRVASRAQSDRVAAELHGGAAFASVAVRFSEDEATRARGGDLGRLSADDPVIPSFIRDAVRRMKVGQISPALQDPSVPPAGAVKRYFYVHLIGRQEAAASSFESVAGLAERMALLEKAGGAANAERKVEDFRRRSVIRVLLPGLEDLYAPAP